MRTELLRSSLPDSGTKESIPAPPAIPSFLIFQDRFKFNSTVGFNIYKYIYIQGDPQRIRLALEKIARNEFNLFFKFLVSCICRMFYYLIIVNMIQLNSIKSLYSSSNKFCLQIAQCKEF